MLAAAVTPASPSLVSTAALVGISFFFVSLIPLIGVSISIYPSRSPRLSLYLSHPPLQRLLLLHLPHDLIPFVCVSFSPPPPPICPSRRLLYLPLLHFQFPETLSAETYLVIVCRNPIISFGSAVEVLSTLKPCRNPVCQNPVIACRWISLRNLGCWISLLSSSIMPAIIFKLVPICSALHPYVVSFTNF
ncbi:hypothetical protein ACLOJK_034636 [Asimina triloba]